MSGSTPETDLFHACHTWPRYRLFGVTLATNFRFANRLSEGSGDPDLSFTVVREPGPAWRDVRPVFETRARTDEGESLVCVYQRHDCSVLRFTGVADFWIWPHHILCSLHKTAYDYAVEIYLLGAVLSLWLELHGHPVLHGSAVVFDNHCVGFLGMNAGGKSSIAATLMQAGASLLSDDILRIDHRDDGFVCHPGYPQMRMWPHEAEHFLGDCHGLPRVHPELEKRRVPVSAGGLGSFCSSPQALACLYLLERHDVAGSTPPVEIASVPRGQELIELVRYSFLAHIIEALGVQAKRLDAFKAIALRTPMRRIVYPNGLQHLARVGEAIVADVARLRSTGPAESRPTP